jgi:ATP-dependent Clp protease ATP-binding subunit ClpB
VTALSRWSGCCWRLVIESSAETSKILSKAGLTAQALNQTINEIRKGRTADSAGAEQGFDALKKYARDLTQAARDGKLDPGDWP